VPYLTIGALVIAAIAAGTVLLRRPPLDARRPASATAPEEARADPAPAPAPADVPRQPPAAAPVEVAASPATPAVEPSASPSRADPAAVAALPAAAPAAPQPKVEPAPKAEVEDAARLLATADQRYAAGRYAEAITAYRRAIALEPTAAARVALARALYDAHRDAEAMRELDRVIGANPRDASAWLLRGDIHQGEGRSDKARDAYQRYLELEPDGEQARVVRTILGRDP
jgi:tetratricopeptide (TPR) repeat protein